MKNIDPSFPVHLVLNREVLRKYENQPLWMVEQEVQELLKTFKRIRSLHDYYDNYHKLIYQTWHGHPQQYVAQFIYQPVPGRDRITSGITLWKYGYHYGSVSLKMDDKTALQYNHPVITTAFADKLEDLCIKSPIGHMLCNDCNKSFPVADMRSYSFAGIVCQGCYDPAKHLPPDTRGD